MSKRNKILVVEDTRMLANLLCQILEEENFDIQVAVNGQEALEKTVDFMPDLILLDIMLPILDGFTVCEKLKESDETKDIPIIFLTGKAQTDDIVKGLELGAVDYVLKPFEETVLLARINTHIDLKNHRDDLAKANQKLKELNATKDKFFSIIAHDLRSPFTSLMGFSQYLYSSLATLKPEEVKSYCGHINDAAKKAYNLLENLLKWAQAQTGKLSINLEVSEFRELGAEVAALLETNIAEKNIEFVVDLEKNIFAVIDRNMVDTVCRNLISNAKKFTREGGRIEFSIRREDDLIKISVKDNGCGMSPEALDNLFRIDQCVSTDGTNGEKGTGLGLVLCREFVEKNNGTLSVESEKNKGTTFTVCFTACDAPEDE